MLPNPTPSGPSELPLAFILRTIANQHDVPAGKLRPESRLAADLGIWGDDARALVDAIHDRYGTDFSAVRGAAWKRCFGGEPAMPAIGYAMALVAGFVALPIAAQMDRLTLVLVALAFIAVIGLGVLWPRLFPPAPSVPVTVADLVDAVRRGRFDPALSGSCAEPSAGRNRSPW